MIVKTKKVLITAVVCFLAALSFSGSASAYSPFQNYTYDYRQKSQNEPDAYTAVSVIDEGMLKTTLNDPQDLCVYGNRIYIADTGNDRIVVCDSKGNLLKVLANYENNGNTDSFSKPEGVFITETGRLYIADTENGRILEFDKNYLLVRELGPPESSLISSEIIYRPRRICVDKAGRMFVVSEGINQGMLELDRNGEFVSFFGAVQTSPTFGQLILRFFATKAQRERLSLIVPTEYSSNDIDADGFVYGTVSALDPKTATGELFIHRLNSLGNDILRRNGNGAPVGDLETAFDSKTNDPLISMLTDICVRDCGIYTVLDRRYGRLFTYDREGRLMYVFGALGNSLGQFSRPAAVDILESGEFAVLDSELCQIVLFEPTEYGKIITEAVRAYYNQDYEKANEIWPEALKYTSKSELAYVGIGDSLMKQNKYKEAMEYYKLGNNRNYYSAAFENYRKIVADKWFFAIADAVLLITGLLIFRRFRKSRRGGRE